MSGFDDHPGGGFSHVDGYNDPAGSQAEQERQRQEDEQRRQQQEAERHAREAEQQAEQQARQPEPRRSSASAALPGGRRAQPRVQPRAAPRAPAARAPFNGFFGLVGFLAAGFWAVGKVGGEGDGKWLAGLLAGLVAGAILGRYYKPLLAVAALVGVIWFLGRPDASERESNPLRTDFSIPTVEPTEPSYTPSEPPPAALTAPTATLPTVELDLPRRWDEPIDTAQHLPNTTPLPPGVVGSLFASPDDFDIYSESRDGQPLSLFVYHAPVIDYDAIVRLEYHRAYERVVVVRKHGLLVDLGVPIGGPVRPAWEELRSVNIVRTKEGEVIEGYRFDLVQVPAW